MTPVIPDTVGDSPVVIVEPPRVQVCPDGVTCVTNPDMAVFIQLLKDARCRDEKPPEITADSVNIIVDREGRVYGSGTGPKPFTVRVKWCNYELTGASNMQLQVAQRVEPTWGFRLRLKATAGLLAIDAFKEDKLYEALDGGVLVEPFFVQWANVNGYVGFRSFGAGLGADLTTNMGVYAGYALTWGSWRSNVFTAISFAF